MMPERSCCLCPTFEHWTSTVVGVIQDDGHVWAADKACALKLVEDWRIVDPDQITDLQAATS